MTLRMQQPIDQAHRAPQPAQVAVFPTPIDGVPYPKPCREVTRALLDEHEVAPRRHLVGQVRVRLTHEVELGAHLLEAEMRVVEADAYRATLGSGPGQRFCAHGKRPCPRPYLNSAATNVVPRPSMPPRSTAPSPKRAFAWRASSLKLEAFAKRASLAKRASRRLC